jgi:hypothetical protein
MEYAFEGDQLADAHELAPSVFTSALVEGLETGEADRDQDGQVSLDELYDYVYDKVRVTTPNQTPGKWTFGVQGDIYVAQRARPVSTPTPLPSELQHAIDHPIAGVRIGAVSELARLIRSRHAGLALAARLALEHLADDDSRTVSAAAVEALAAAPKREAGPPVPQAGRPAPKPSPSLPKPGPPKQERVPTPAAEAPKVPAAPAPEPVPASPLPSGAPRPDRRLPVAGGIAILGALLVVLSMFPKYHISDSSSLGSYPYFLRYVVVLATVVAASAIAIVIPRSRGLVSTGVLVGAVAASTDALMGSVCYMLSVPSFSYFLAGQWLHLAGHVAFVVAAVLAWRALARTGDVRATLRPRRGLMPYLVILLGVVNAAALLSIWAGAYRYDNTEASRFEYLWIAAVALLVCLYAATASPRRLGAALLGGWAAGGAALVVSFLRTPTLVDQSDNQSGIYLFAATLVALLIAAVPLSRAR